MSVSDNVSKHNNSFIRSQLYFLIRYRNRIEMDITQESDPVSSDLLKSELKELNEVIYEHCEHSFMRDTFETSDRLIDITICIHCQLEKK
jgi:hypothetical protein